MPDLTLSPGLSIHYLDENPQGRSPVLLLHGLGATGASWQLQAPALVEAGFRVIAPDARGFGASTWPGGIARVADLASDMARLLEALGATPAHVVGISMGGALALQLTLDAPHLLRRLVLANTFAALRPPRLSGYAYFGFRYLLVLMAGHQIQGQAVARRIFPRPEQEQYRRELLAEILQANPQGYRSAMRALARFNVQSRLREIRVPTLVVTAAGDTTIPPLTQARLAQGIPNARQSIIPNAGHAVTIDQPAHFNQILLEFLYQES